MNNSLREMGSNTTALEDAYQKMSNTTAEQSKRFMVHIKNMAITLGSQLLPAVNGAMDTLGKLLSGDMAGAKLGGLDLLHRMGLDDAQAARVMGVFETVGQDLFNFTTKYIGAMKNFDFSPMIGMLEHLRGILRPILDFVGKVFPQNVKLMNAVYPALSNALGALRPVVQMIFGSDAGTDSRGRKAGGAVCGAAAHHLLAGEPDWRGAYKRLSGNHACHLRRHGRPGRRH